MQIAIWVSYRPTSVDALPNAPRENGRDEREHAEAKGEAHAESGARGEAERGHPKQLPRREPNDSRRAGETDPKAILRCHALMTRVEGGE